MKRPTRLFLDMDGVLVDWDLEYERITGMHPEHVHSLNDKHVKNTNWETFIKSGGFINAPPMKDWKTLVHYVYELLKLGKVVDVQICTSAGGKKFYDEVKRQKLIWLRRHGLDFKPNVVEAGSKKSSVLNPSYRDILIDDTPRVLDYFLTAGGEGVLHTSANETISKLDEMVWE